ncbi:FldA protein [Roseibium sp. TrichSKD4]|uniref:4-oxalomesaconate tautomerase n=1 Tax=Roseibium sp. TrichSKD4 TaxID=744980 RepID=UPI0001E56DFD|nr:4-oxalomesaconate tautomerase [Roseibium sp. TrichSKD4]EFO32006.1 FldA protein [Roseibium sp. TrichSKD4]
MSQSSVPFLFMRGGTSRGPYFQRADLPEDLEDLSKVLTAVVGAGHSLNIDGIGGGAAVTTKVAMLSKSQDNWADVDYFFAQVKVDEEEVDFKPTCGNILYGVGPAAIEMGLVEPQGDETRVRIHAVNTGARVEAILQTPGGVLTYEGEARIDGVPGTAAPILLNFMDVVGSATGKLFPTGSPSDMIEGHVVTCIDVAMPMVIGKAEDFGISGYETREELDANSELMARIEKARIAAGEKMGMGDVSKSVTPKFALLAPARSGGTISARYFMPWQCHPTMAVSGAQCISSCTLCPGTIAEGMAALPEDIPAQMLIEHPSGEIGVTVDYENGANGFDIKSAGLLRTARLLASGDLMVPAKALT